MSQAAVGPAVSGRVTDASARRRIGVSVVRPILMLGGIAVVLAGVAYYWLSGDRDGCVRNRRLGAGA